MLERTGDRDDKAALVRTPTNSFVGGMAPSGSSKFEVWRRFNTSALPFEINLSVGMAQQISAFKLYDLYLLLVTETEQSLLE
jgi:hypothetical protein